MVEERAIACALKYRQKLRRLHLSHTDYYLDSVHRTSNAESDVQEQISKSTILTRTSIVDDISQEDHHHHHHILSVSVV
jgi:hypothetical protein